MTVARIGTPAPRARVRTRVEVPVDLGEDRVVPATVVSFDGLCDDLEHVAVELGPSPRPGRAPLVRLHSECLTGDVLGSQRCDCGPQLREGLRRLADEGGVLLYLRQEGRGIGLYAKLEAYRLQDAGLDTYEANLALGFAEDARDYTVAGQMLHALGLDRIRLLSNNPDKAAQLTRLGIDVAARVPTSVHLSDDNADYLAAKVRRAAHTLDLGVSPSAPPRAVRRSR
jgi:GTP cyclohydrolase II